MRTSTQAIMTNAHRTFFALAVIFALPLFFAWLISIGPLEWMPVKTVSHGVLLKPPPTLGSYGVTNSEGVVLDVNGIARDWYLVVLHSSACTEQCQDLLQIAATVKLAAGRDSSRITLVKLGPVSDEISLAPVVSERWLLPADGKFVSELHHASGRTSDQPLLDNSLLIVDHRGRGILIYPSSTDGSGVLDDVKRLLRSTAR